MRLKGLIITLALLCLLCITPIKVNALESVSNSNYAYILADPTTTTVNNSNTSPSATEDGVEICDDDIRRFIDDYWKIFVISAPGLLIMMISIDFFKAVMSSDEDLIKKASNNAIKRTAATIILLMLPYILRMIFGWAGLDICL